MDYDGVLNLLSRRAVGLRPIVLTPHVLQSLRSLRTYGVISQDEVWRSVPCGTLLQLLTLFPPFPTFFRLSPTGFVDDA